MSRETECRKKSVVGLLLVLLVGALHGGDARAVDLETLVMPGPLVAGHADLESDCNKCHEPFKAARQDRLCLDCHEDVAADVEAKGGFHGRVRPDGEPACKACHPEHEGREADIAGLNREVFDHALTDFELAGAHRKVPCESCHVAAARFREAPASCVECHRDDSPHRGQLGDDCESCHGTEAWGKAGFDHATTDFPLVGLHRKVECSLCHPNQRYARTPDDCSSCHELDDVHGGRLGKKCQSCHSPRGWSRSAFDHDRKTKFPLRGAHAKTTCQACHAKPPLEEKLATDCLACHRTDDAHRGRFGRDCEQCHDSRAWKPAHFDHDKATDHPLRGAHRDVSCQRCHTGALFGEDLPNDCYGCHRGDDVHEGNQGRDCARCHTEESWGGEVVFDHDLAAFPLLGMHAVVSCEECHVSGGFGDAPTACLECHRSRDVHERRLGEACADCHNPNGWRRWRFDHDTQSKFALHGAHEGLDCHSCHRQPVRGEIRLSTACYQCHERDDDHRGAFGRRCENCHSTSAWDDTRELIR